MKRSFENSLIRTVINPYGDQGVEFEDWGQGPDYDASYVRVVEKVVLCAVTEGSLQEKYARQLKGAYSDLLRDIAANSFDFTGYYVDEQLNPRQVALETRRDALNLKEELVKIILDSSALGIVTESIVQDLGLGRKSVVLFFLTDIIEQIQMQYDSNWMTRVVNENFPVFVHSESKLALSLIKEHTPELVEQLNEERLAIKNKAYDDLLQSRVRKPKDPSEGRPISSKDEAVEIARQDVLKLKLLSYDLRKDRSFVKSLITEKGEVISPFREEYGDDEELVLLALKSYKDTLLFCSPRLRNSASFAMKAIEIRGLTYRMFPDSVRANEDVCRAAVRKSKENFKYLPVRMQELDSMRSLVGLEPIITDAIEAERMLREDGSKFYSLSRELRRNPELIVLAAKEHPSILNILEEDVWTVELCVSLFKWELRDFEILPKALKKDEQFLQQLIPKVPGVLALLPWKLQKNQALQDLANWGNYPEKEVDNCARLPNAMLISAHRNNLRFIEAVLSRNGMVLEFCEPNVQNDEAFVRVAMDQNPEALKWASQRLQKKLG